jgi:hypothetical protein
MQSFITTTQQTNVTHAKVEFNNEFRRFALETLNFSYLEQLVRALFEIGATTAFKIHFLDDEKDWVLISSDEELTYAASLVGSPLRLAVKLANVLPARASSETVQEKPNRPMRERIDFSDPEARKAHKISCISSRVEILETKLANNDLPAGKAKAISEKVTILKQKLENLKTGKTTPAASPATQLEENVEETYGRRCGRGRFGGHGRGRGCGNRNEPGNGRGGRGGWKREHEPLSPELQPILSRVQDCKMELRAARHSKNEQDIQAKWEALQQAKAEWRAAKFGGEARPGRGCKPQRAALPEWEELKQKKEAKHVCMNNLRNARTAGNQVDIEACHLALFQAKEELFAAKLALRAAKQGTQNGSL